MASFVEQQVFAQMTQSVEGRILATEGRLNELFGTVDQRFVEAQTAQNKIEVQLTQLSGGLERMNVELSKQGKDLDIVKTEVPQRLSDLLQESRNVVEQRAQGMETMYGQVHEMIRQLQLHTQSMQTEINQLERSPTGGTGSESKMKSLLDTKQFTIKTLDGAPEHKMALEDWRDDMKEYLEAFRPHIKVILGKAARWKK